jgi:D-sedoheptulose 7-phosphate isomerase
MKSFIDSYQSGLQTAMESVNAETFSSFMKALCTLHKEGRRLFVIGNGGSAATASHFACDLGKNAVPPGNPRFKVVALTDSIPAITAYGNDNGYASVFAEQLTNLMASGDILLAISASGNSPNIIEAVTLARESGLSVIGMAGFDGGKLAELSDWAITIPGTTYEQIEDAHMILTHMIVLWFKQHPEALLDS